MFFLYPYIKKVKWGGGGGGGGAYSRVVLVWVGIFFWGGHLLESELQ